MKRIMLIGQSQCGKTSLVQKLRGDTLVYQKTQALDYLDCAIDTPGEYLENRCFYSALITTSCEADVIAFVQSADNPQCFFAPMFATAFNKPVIGIITKSDTMTDEHGLEFAREQLKQAGAKSLFVTSSMTGDGISPLLEYLN